MLQLLLFAEWKDVLFGSKFLDDVVLRLVSTDMFFFLSSFTNVLSLLFLYLNIQHRPYFLK